MGDEAAFWDKRADRYARKPIRDVASYERTLERTRTHLSPDDEVLEVGCGTGTTALRLAPSVRRILATDVSSRMIHLGREKAAAQGVENVRFERATLADGNLDEGGFDVVLAFNLLHLVEDLPGAVRRVHALLGPGGRFISKTACLAEQTRLWGLVLAPMRLVGLAPAVHVLGIAELEGIVRDAGFEIVETGIFPPSPPSRFLVARKV